MLLYYWQSVLYALNLSFENFKKAVPALLIHNITQIHRYFTSLGSLARAIVPSLLYLIGDPPSCTKVPYPVLVKKAGMPAPPARIRSARVP